jgi:signal transduction histidine kinase
VKEDPASRAGLNRRNLAFDGIVAVALTGVALSITVPLLAGLIPSVPLVAATFLAGAHNLALVGRRIWPVGVLSVQIATGLAVSLLDLPLVALGVGIIVGIYTVASQRPIRTSLGALLATEVAAVVAPWASDTSPNTSTLVGNAAVLFASWYVGNSTFARRTYVAQLERRNEELNRARQELAQTAVVEERLRIARELHDVIAHSMSMISVQSGVGAHVIHSNPEEAKRSLQTIEEASKSALTEIRRMLGILRQTDDGAKLDPMPRLEDVDDLIARVEASGPKVDLQVFGDVSRLSAGTDLTAYRIVQEALTNVVNHANCSRARVVITRSDEDLRIEIVDDGSGGRSSPTGGHGLVGMRERVELFGGEFQAGPLPEGGFRVRAYIPLKAP